MSKDLSEALGQLSRAAQYQEYKPQPPEPLPVRGEAAAVKSSAPLPGGGNDSNGSAFEASGELTLTSTDGLFTFHFPDTLITTIGDISYTVGVVQKSP